MKTPLLLHDFEYSKVKDATTFYMIGMPFNGQMIGNTDLHGTRFTRNTYIGHTPNIISTYLEHGMLPDVRFMPMGRTVVTDTILDEGRLFEVLVNNSHKYYNVLMKLKEMKLLRGSAQALGSGYKVGENGDLDVFVPAEFSFTVMPSNLMSVEIEPDRLRSVYRSIIQKGKNEMNLENTIRELGTISVSDVARSVAQQSEPASEDVQEQEQTQVQQDTEDQSSALTLESIASQLSELQASVDGLSRSITRQEEDSASFASTVDSGFKVVADVLRNIHTRFDTLVSEEAISRLDPKQLSRNTTSNNRVSNGSSDDTSGIPSARITPPVQRQRN